MVGKSFSIINAQWHLTSKSLGHILDSWGASVRSLMIIGGLQSRLWSRNRFQSSMPHDLDLWPFDAEINRAHSWLVGSMRMKFHDYRWITESREIIFNHQCQMTLTFNLLTPKLLGHILDPWGANVWSFMILGGLQGHLWSGNHFQSSMTLTFGPEINRAHPCSWGACVWSFMIIGWLQSQLWSGNHLQLTMPHDLDLWLQNQKGTSLTHGE